MNDPLVTIHSLRRQCAAMLERIDAALAACDLPTEPALLGMETMPLFVSGRSETVTRHAMTRFRERTGTNKGDTCVCNRIASRLASAEEWELRPKFRVIEMLAHGQQSRYFKHNDLLFVVESGVLITVHHGTADRWQKRPDIGITISTDGVDGNSHPPDGVHTMDGVTKELEPAN